MQQTPATMALGCGGSLILLGSFVSGFYLGQSEARGLAVDPSMATALKWGPAVIASGYSAIATAAQMNVPGNLEELVQHSPPEMSAEQAEGCARGCAPVFGAVGGGLTMAAVTYIGYAVGHSLR